MSVQSISPRELDALCRSGRLVDLIDVRTPVEFREIHVAMARNVPLDTLNPESIQAARGDRQSEPLYVICRSGSRGKQACEKFIASGITQVINVEGGTVACDNAGLQVVRGPKGIALERQVRIVIGLLVLTGSILTQFVHPYWLGLPAFMGASLIFSGIADFCGLALILARMPWNRVTAPACKTQNACSPRL